MLESMAPYLKADVLKVAHHGSITSSTESVLKLIDPKFAVIFVGKGNKFRHPSPIVMERLGRLGIQIHRTDMNSAAWFQTDGQEIWKRTWQ